MTDKSDKLISPIVLNFPDGTKKRFVTISSLRSWLTKEQQFVQELLKIRAPHFNNALKLLTQILDFHNAITNDVLQELNAYQPHAASASDLQQRHQRIRAFLRPYETGTLLRSDSSAAKTLRTYLEQRDDVGDFKAIGFLIGVSTPFPPSVPGHTLNVQIPTQLFSHPDYYLAGAFWEGFIEGLLRRTNWVPDMKSEIESLIKVRNEMSSVVVDAQQSIESFKEEFDGLKNALEEQKKACDKDFKSSQNKRDATFTKFLENSEQRVSTLEERLQDNLLTQKPAKFWRRLSTQYKKAARWWGVAFVVYGTALIGLVYFFGADFLSAVFKVTNNHVTADGAPLSKSYVTSSTILVFVTALAALIPGRILARLWIRNLALRDDAAHRANIATSFLALRGIEDALTKDERILVIQALFRPSPNLPDSVGVQTGTLMDFALSKITGKDKG